MLEDEEIILSEQMWNKLCVILQAFCFSLMPRVPTVRESLGILNESGKVRENREGQGKVREF